MAARIYDKNVIFNHGLKAKTNFNYTKRQLHRLLQREDDFNLSESDLDEAELIGEAKLNLQKTSE